MCMLSKKLFSLKRCELKITKTHSAGKMKRNTAYLQCSLEGVEEEKRRKKEQKHKKRRDSWLGVSMYSQTREQGGSQTA